MQETGPTRLADRGTNPKIFGTVVQPERTGGGIDLDAVEIQFRLHAIVRDNELTGAGARVIVRPLKDRGAIAPLVLIVVDGQSLVFAKTKDILRKATTGRLTVDPKFKRADGIIQVAKRGNCKMPATCKAAHVELAIIDPMAGQIRNKILRFGMVSVRCEV